MKVVLTKTDNMLKQYVVNDVVECATEGDTLILVFNTGNTKNIPLINLWSWDCVMYDAEGMQVDEGEEVYDDEDYIGFLAGGISPDLEDEDFDEDDFDDEDEDEDFDDDNTIICEKG